MDREINKMLLLLRSSYFNEILKNCLILNKWLNLSVSHFLSL